MIRIPCPFCGVRDHTEFSYGRDGSIEYPELGAPMEDWLHAVFQRKNIRGKQLETWHHVYGCRMWLIVERDTNTHEIVTVKLASNHLEDLIEDSE